MSECLVCVAISAGPDSPCRRGSNNILPKYGFHHCHVDHADDANNALNVRIPCMQTHTLHANAYLACKRIPCMQTHTLYANAYLICKRIPCMQTHTLYAYLVLPHDRNPTINNACNVCIPCMQIFFCLATVIPHSMKNYFQPLLCRLEQPERYSCRCLCSWGSQCSQVWFEYGMMMIQNLYYRC